MSEGDHKQPTPHRCNDLVEDVIQACFEGNPFKTVLLEKVIFKQELCRALPYISENHLFICFRCLQNSNKYPVLSSSSGNACAQNLGKILLSSVFFHSNVSFFKVLIEPLWYFLFKS
ncbi:hypothetical protein RHGRI_011924 [Rhododendron griersonianum]|uniref:Uncharacterized protein n=1 Tax=Rhododendron griersonianum TaxID=479676 RepID=A0AAV6KNR9_9ERIC|nr:hypothetical protein RHGRI_011924 [Rhododendron griersonianum]